MLNVQKFLQTNSKEDLTASLGIHVKQHPKYPELFHFSYDQLESPKDNPIVHECRGLVLNSAKDWEVVAFPFRRFANQGEMWSAPIDWNTVRVQEKVDGSLMILWFYDGRWNVSTKGSPDAGGTVGDFGFTFSELFWETMKLRYADVVFNPHYTYMIEMTSPYNRVVCSYGADVQFTLIGIRDVVRCEHRNYPALRELSVYDVNIGIPPVREYPMTSLSEIESAATALDPMQNEGFVVVDKSYNRVKIKSPSYVMIHHMKDGFGQRRMIRLIQLGETSEVLSYFPEYQTMFEEINVKIETMLAEIEDEYARIEYIQDRKEFALEAVKSKNSGVLFAMYLGAATSIRDYVLYSKRVIRKATATEPAVEDFYFAEDKIERMAGLSAKKIAVIE